MIESLESVDSNILWCLGMCVVLLPGTPLVGNTWMSIPLVDIPFVGIPYVGVPYVGVPYVGIPYVGVPYVGVPVK